MSRLRPPSRSLVMEDIIEPSAGMYCRIYVEHESIFADYDRHLYKDGETVKVAAIHGDTASCIRVAHASYPYGDDCHKDDLTPTYSPDYVFLKTIIDAELADELETTLFPYFCEIPTSLKLLALQNEPNWQTLLAEAAYALDKELSLSDEVDVYDWDPEVLEQIDYMFDVISGNYRPGVHRPEVECWHNDGEWLPLPEPASPDTTSTIAGAPKAESTFEPNVQGSFITTLQEKDKVTSDSAAKMLCIFGGKSIRKDCIRYAFHNLPIDKQSCILTSLKFITSIH